MNQLDLVSKATRLRRELGEDASSPIDIFALAQRIDKLTLFLYPLGEGISGMCIKTDDSCVIAINSSMSKGRQRFTLAHELYHYKYGNVGETTICSSNLTSGSDASIEQEADRFASYLLLPPGAFEDRLESNKREHGQLLMSDLIWIEQQFGISHQAMLWRLNNDQTISPSESLALKDGVTREARRLGYDTELYRIIGNENAERRVLGYYVKMADILLDQGKISDGKYNELMLDGFRADIVFGDEEDDQIDD
jgi:Zn-dependent peptidase ImmA (M78 family)